MNYEETLHYLYQQLPEYQRIGHLAYKEGLDNSLALDAYFHHPHHHFKTIHVAGTNGKGSTCHLLAAILQESGYKVGLYTSPHLLDFRERIRVNGKMIDKNYVVDFVEKHRAAFEPIKPSFFELSMEMAFLYFADCKVDVAVIEVGLGGRLDSTNIISPDLCVITNIGFDHMQYLGNTLPKIAAEKAGIIKAGVPVVIGEIEAEDVRSVFVEKARKEGSPLVFAETALPHLSSVERNEEWIFDAPGYPALKDELGGWAQQKNARTVLVAVEELKKAGYSIPPEAVHSGFAKVVELTGLMGRWQVVNKRPKTVCDTGHNAHGIRYIAGQLKHEHYRLLHIVFGMVNDKDINAVLALLPKDAVYYFTRASVERAMDEKTLATQAAAFGLQGGTYPTVASAVHEAQKKAAEDDFIFIGGSSFIVADALPLFL
ncbi:bifunctional folylpolyglutamate synthase/dihydrofolate synthase [Limibacterium fermenti]|jgi:dihydrofolate synthase/folylpolyglutamate synthase|uniref:bifunctional folylpolyglutamate synthase/dihydrofolate synthase n=1 Tax=Limibacterium fermenti TaxID=3229863 RepID=UPI000E9127C7|nr:dihydrofolate synthase [Porphyromonadaceae bacterium]HBX44913.1 dihydrofolate synthase [Porphyromonadaceae bacterium]